MKAGQKLVAEDGYEVALFEMSYMNISQDEGGSYSHQNTYNIDFLGWGANGRINNAPIYAPCTMKVVDRWLNYNGGNNVVFESVKKVHLANGQFDYLTICFAHDPNPPITNIGAIVRQGELCYHTGSYGNVTGDHTHSCCGKGKYRGYTTRTGGHSDLNNRIHYWEALYINDTTIINGANHNWKKFNGISKFKWVLYANKIRRRNKE